MVAIETISLTPVLFIGITEEVTLLTCLTKSMISASINVRVTSSVNSFLTSHLWSAEWDSAQVTSTFVFDPCLLSRAREKYGGP